MPTFPRRTQALSLSVSLSFSIFVVGCGTVVLTDDADDDGVSTSGRTSTSTSAQASTTSVAASATSSSTGGAPIPPLACAQDESVLVAATAQAGTQASRVVGGTWSPLWSGQPMWALVAYTDPYRRFGLLANDTEGIPHMLREEEPGLVLEHLTSFTPRPPFFLPLGASETFGPLLTRSDEGWQVAWYDTDAQDWYPAQTFSSDWDPTSVTLDRVTGRVTVAGRTLPGDVCLRETTPEGIFAPTTCVPGVVSPVGEIGNTGPQIVSFDDGTEILLFQPHLMGDLSAIVRQGGAWSAPVTVSSDLVGLVFTAVPSADGDVVVGAVSTSGDLSLLRFSVAAGWSGPVVLGGGYQYAQLGAAPGACGADAFIGVARGGLSVDVARVYGMQAALEFALPFGDDFASNITFAVKRPLR